MKTIPLLSILLLSASAVHADGLTTKVEGFLDIPWGVNEDLVKKNFPQRAHARLDQIRSAPGKLYYVGGKFAKLKVRSFNLDFVSDHFWMAMTTFEQVSKDRMKEYAEIKQLLVEKYGPPDSEEEMGLDHIANWHIGEQPQFKDRIELHTDTRGPGMRIMYAADGTRKNFAPLQPPTPSSTTAPGAKATPKPNSKPISAAPGAKDDL